MKYTYGRNLKAPMASRTIALRSHFAWEHSTADIVREDQIKLRNLVQYCAESYPNVYHAHVRTPRDSSFHLAIDKTP